MMMLGTNRVRASIFLFTLLLGASTLGCGAGPEADPAGPAAEEDFTADVAGSEKLLDEAVKLAVTYETEGCASDVYLSTIADKVRAAIAIRNTPFFRTRVVAKKVELARVLANTLAWQEILGVFEPTRLATLPTALAAGVTLFDVTSSIHGNTRKIAFRAGGKATLYVLDTSATKPVWKETATSWGSDGDGVTLASGERFVATFTKGELELRPEGQRDGLPAFVSFPSECEG
jgi:hypothetical protein